MLGNSFGCQIIAEFAVRHPNRIERAVLQGPTVDRHRVPQQLLRYISNPQLERPSLALIQAYDYWLAGFWRILRTTQIMLEERIEEKLPHMHVPTLVVRGKEDPLVTQQWAEEVVKLLPFGQLAVIPGAGHTLNYSAPLELVRVTRAFLETTKPYATEEKR